MRLPLSPPGPFRPPRKTRRRRELSPPDPGPTLAWIANAPRRLEKLRRIALQVMETLEDFEPYLYGSVLSGKIRPESDVDLLAYADEPDQVADRLLEAGHRVEFRLERSKRRGLVRTYPHYFLELAGAVVELCVYPTAQRRHPPVSSITGHGRRVMRIRIWSDLHLETGTFIPPDADADIVVLAGDVGVGTMGVQWAAATLERPVVYVAGNHEYYGTPVDDLVDSLRREAAGTRVHVLEREAWQHCGTRFLGCTLWSDFALAGDVQESMRVAEERLLDYRRIRPGRHRGRLSAAEVARWHAASVEWLAGALEEPFDGPTVIVTHHAPSAQSLSHEIEGDHRAAAYASALDDLVASSGADLWIHGHVHNGSEYSIGATRVVCNPRGHESFRVADFSPALIVTVGSDAQVRERPFRLPTCRSTQDGP